MILKKNFNFTSDVKKLLIYEFSISNNFIKGSFIEIIDSIVYKFESIKLYYYVLRERYDVLDENIDILHTFYSNIRSKEFIFKNLHIFKDLYYYEISDNINFLKLKLCLERIDEQNITEFNLKLTNEYQNNYICLKILKYDIIM